jgi:hypothetical protein
MTRRAKTAGAALAIVLVASLSAVAQEPTRPALMPVPRDGQPWRIERIADIPAPLKSAIDRTQCRLEDSILHELPIQIFRPGRPVIAIVPCGSIIFYGRAFVFERDQGIEPKPMLFPTLAAPSGFGNTDTPGVLAWDAATKTLTATRGNDVVGNDETRHTYRYDAGQANWLTLIRIETRKKEIGGSETEWTPIWEAQAWPKLRL